jgi:cellobiose PTS system EIIB component
MRILVVCGAGASSTFVAQRVRRAAHERGLAHAAVAGTLTSLEIDLDSADILLVGPHLTGEHDRIARIAAAHGVAMIVLPEDAFTDLTGERTLALVTTASAAPTPETTA